MFGVLQDEDYVDADLKFREAVARKLNEMPPEDDEHDDDDDDDDTETVTVVAGKLPLPSSPSFTPLSQRFAKQRQAGLSNACTTA